MRNNFIFVDLLLLIYVYYFCSNDAILSFLHDSRIYDYYNDIWFCILSRKEQKKKEKNKKFHISGIHTYYLFLLLFLISFNVKLSLLANGILILCFHWPSRLDFVVCSVVHCPTTKRPAIISRMFIRPRHPSAASQCIATRCTYRWIR